MSRYILEYSDGETIELEADNDAEAEHAALARFDDDAVAADQWDTFDLGDDGTEPIERLLIWSSEADAFDDAGQNAIAQIRTTRER